MWSGSPGLLPCFTEVTEKVPWLKSSPSIGFVSQRLPFGLICIHRQVRLWAGSSRMIHLSRGSQILSRRPQVYKDPRKWQQNASLVVVILAAKKGGGGMAGGEHHQHPSPTDNFTWHANRQQPQEKNITIIFKGIQTKAMLLYHFLPIRLAKWKRMTHLLLQKI